MLPNHGFPVHISNIWSFTNNPTARPSWEATITQLAHCSIPFLGPNGLITPAPCFPDCRCSRVIPALASLPCHTPLPRLKHSLHKLLVIASKSPQEPRLNIWESAFTFDPPTIKDSVTLLLSSSSKHLLPFPKLFPFHKTFSKGSWLFLFSFFLLLLFTMCIYKTEKSYALEIPRLQPSKSLSTICLLVLPVCLGSSLTSYHMDRL